MGKRGQRVDAAAASELSFHAKEAAVTEWKAPPLRSPFLFCIAAIGDGAAAAECTHSPESVSVSYYSTLLCSVLQRRKKRVREKGEWHGGGGCLHSVALEVAQSSERTLPGGRTDHHGQRRATSQPQAATMASPWADERALLVDFLLSVAR